MTTLPSWLCPFQHTFPSANITLIKGTKPILIDSGYGSDIRRTLAWLASQDVYPQGINMILNTHYHADHVGGNHYFQTQYGTPIGAQRWEALQINHGDSTAWSLDWLRQAIEPYTVDRLLLDGDVIDAGDIALQVIHTPGHSLGHVSFYTDGYLIAGDTFHAEDVAWLGIFREGAGAIYRMLETLDKLAQLPLKWSFSGHGAPTDKPLDHIDIARRRYEKWIEHPEKVAWHAMKRIVTYAIMLEDGMTQTRLNDYLLNESPWFADYAGYAFQTTPADFIGPLITELLRSGAVRWQDGVLLPNAPYHAPSKEWLTKTYQKLHKA